MAKDAGGVASGADPNGVVAGSGRAIAIVDPLGNPTGYIYLFLTDGTLSPAAGKNYADYTYRLTSGNYKQTYNTGGNNPETSTGVTSRYRVGFKDRWIHDETRITVGTATGVDILDRHKVAFAPGVCSRSTDTFSAGGGAIIASIDGPVRAIRSVLGANSGSTTQRDWTMYEGRMDVTTFIRVHAIRSLFINIDWSPAAVGMTYHDNLNPGGVTVDGKPDTMNAGHLTWQLLTGKPGSVTIARHHKTDIPNWIAKQSSFYDDDATPSWTQCTGDAFAFATAGSYVSSGVPNTDPLRGPANSLTDAQTLYYEAPGVTTSLAAARAAAAASPLVGAQLRLDLTSAARPGATVPLVLTAAGSRGLVYQAGASLGDGPIPIDSRALRLSPDALFWISVNGLLPQVFSGFAGRLDSRGQAKARVRVPADAGLIGIDVRLAFITIDAGAPSGVREIAPTARLMIRK